MSLTGQWPITAGPGKFDLMLAAFGEKEGPLTFTIGETLRHSKQVSVNGLLRESGKDAFIVFGQCDGQQVMLWYTTKRDKRPNLGFLEFKAWSL